ncbi:unnamed protein product [Rotaria sp. Silwood2]|nr:unnamed protein product [Rotaria sp. Silwood2]
MQYPFFQFPNECQRNEIIENPFRIIEHGEPNFLRYCLALKILYAIPNRDSECDEFIQFCQENDLLQYISELDFSRYPEQAIQFYSRSSGFSSKIINSTCRAQDPLLISKIRYYLKHLHEQLTRLYIDSLFWIPKFITVYRGQRFSLKEFQKLVQFHGKTILTTQYLSTTGAYNIAVAFADSKIHPNESLQDEIAVIFKISILTKNSRLKPFAYIQEYSHIKDEKEILISMGTIFSFIDIYKRGENLYEILLTHDQAEKEIEEKILYNAIELCSIGTTITIGAFLISMNIHIPLDNDFCHQPLTSLLEEYSQFKSKNIINLEKLKAYQNTIKIKQLATKIVQHSSTASPTMSINNWPMGVTHNHLIIWLDQHIGLNNACVDLKKTLADAVNLTTDEPLLGHEIDRLILNEKIYHSTRELITVTTIEQCLQLINTNRDKRIFLITSGSLGQQFVPDIREHVNWAIEFTDNLLMFDFPNDLLARVVYDIGMYYMQRAIDFRNSNDHMSALYCLYYSKKLVIRANRIFQPFVWFSLNAIEEYITREENLLPRNLVQHILNNI